MISLGHNEFKCITKIKYASKINFNDGYMIHCQLKRNDFQSMTFNENLIKLEQLERLRSEQSIKNLRTIRTLYGGQNWILWRPTGSQR